MDFFLKFDYYDYLFTDIENLYKKLFIDKKENVLKKTEYNNQISKKNPSYINVLKIINNYFNNWVFSNLLESKVLNLFTNLDCRVRINMV